MASWKSTSKAPLLVSASSSILGFVINTMTVTVGEGKSGHYDLHEVSYRDDGSLTTASSEEGRYKSIGKFEWATTGVIKVDGKAFAEEGVMQLATRTWSGKFYEIITG